MRGFLSFSSVALVLMVPLLTRADDPLATKPAQKEAQRKGDRGLEEMPPKFVPLRPRTTEDRDRQESLRLFAAARALEDRHQLTDALALLEKARALSPDSPAILRRISRIDEVLGRNDQAVAVARKLIEIEPGDATAVALLVAHYLERKNDPAGAEATLKRIAANPKLKSSSPGYFLIQRVLGDLYAEVLNKPDDAAEAYAKLMLALDDPAANALSTSERQRVIEGDEASSYIKFGDAFLKANQFAQAANAFRRGLIYKPDHPTLPRLLAQALAGAGQRAEALAVLEPYLKRMPAGNDAYDLLAEILDNMGRGSEVLPRLQAAAGADSKNLRLKFLLAERLRTEGQGDKADVMLTELLKQRADPEVYAALAQSYKKEKKPTTSFAFWAKPWSATAGRGRSAHDRVALRRPRYGGQGARRRCPDDRGQTRNSDDQGAADAGDHRRSREAWRQARRARSRGGRGRATASNRKQLAIDSTSG